MVSKHTPGPWHVTEDAETNIRDERRRLIGRAFDTYGDEDPNRPGIRRRENTRPANARLIAAAPAFLAACTQERDTVSRLDWLSALLSDLRQWDGPAYSDDPEAAATALRESEALLADLRAAVKQAQGQEGGRDA